MSDGIYSALSGAIAQQRSLDVVANNVANATTTGYRGDRVAFSEALGRASQGPAPDALRFVSVSAVRFDTAQGSLRATGNPLDLALQGEGYLSIATPAGERYTRAGALAINAEGILQTQAGHQLVTVARDPDARIRIPVGAREVSVGPDGSVNVDGQNVGRLKIVRFQAPTDLVKEGNTNFAVAPGMAPLADDLTQVVQGHLEAANVNAVAGMNELILASRSFEAFQRVISTFREIDTRTARELGNR